MGSFVQIILWNKKNSFTKIFRKTFEKNLDWFLKKYFWDSLKTFSKISVPNFEAVCRCWKPVIEPVLVMTLVFSHKMKTDIQHFDITLKCI